MGIDFPSIYVSWGQNMFPGADYKREQRPSWAAKRKEQTSTGVALDSQGLWKEQKMDEGDHNIHIKYSR